MPLFADTVYTIDTDYGEKTVVVPDGYTETDVLLAIAKSYYELNEEDKILKDKIDTLTTQVSTYVDENKFLRERNSLLQENYNQLVQKQKTQNSMGFVRGFATGHLSFVREVTGGGLDVGVIFGDSLIIKVGVEYPLEFNVGVGFVF